MLPCRERAGPRPDRLGTTAGAEEIKDTAVTQPLVVATALLAAQRCTIPVGASPPGIRSANLPPPPIAGVLPALDAVELAAVRGAAMGAACALTPTGMSALMGGDADAVLAALAELNLVGANVNGGGQIVAAGPMPALQELTANPPAGVRVIPLPVAGAFHTAYMASAEMRWPPTSAGLTPADPIRPLLTNSDGTRRRFRHALPRTAGRPGHQPGPVGLRACERCANWVSPVCWNCPLLGRWSDSSNAT